MGLLFVSVERVLMVFENVYAFSANSSWVICGVLSGGKFEGHMSSFFCFVLCFIGNFQHVILSSWCQSWTFKC
jgi:hypothetical protein